MADQNIKWQGIGDNLQAAIQGDSLLVRIPNFKERLRPSGSGKTMVVATTGGNQQIDGTGGVKLGVNAFVKV